MDSLPNECLTSIFENFENNNRLLYKCSLISRKWCQINVPILWSEPGHHFKDIRVIEILLLSLNDEEQFQLVPFMFDLPKKRNLSFNYSSLINSVLKIDLNTGVRNWLLSTPHCNDELQVRIVDSLITMLLRSNENIKRISIDGFNTNLIFNHIHNIHYLDLCELTRETVNDLISLLNNHKTLKTLRLFSNRTNIIESDQLENLLSTITNNLKTLYISNHRMGRQEGKMFAKFLRRNTGLTSLTLKGDSSWDPSVSSNNLGAAGAIALANALGDNKTLKILNIFGNHIGSEGGKAIADALRTNTSLTSLDIGLNDLTSEDAKLFANPNTTLTHLGFAKNNLGPEGVKALLEKASPKLTSLDLSGSLNRNGIENKRAGGKALANGLCNNTTLNYLNLQMNKFSLDVTSLIAASLCFNATMTSLNFSDNELSEDGAYEIARLIRLNATLISLNLNFNFIGLDGGIEIAGALAHNSRLKFLYLRNNNIGPKAGEAFAEALCNNKTLVTLDLHANKLELEGINALERTLSECISLMHLDLGSNIKVDPNAWLLEIGTYTG